MKIAFLSDIHFGVRKNSDILLNGCVSFFKEQFIPYCLEHSIKTLIIPGDIFDNRVSLNVKTVDATRSLFVDMLDVFDNIYIIAGNHDLYYNTTTDVNSISFLHDIDRNKIHIIDFPRLELIDNKKFVMIPWIVNDKKFKDFIQEETGDFLIGHFDLYGFKMNGASGYSEHGYDTSIFKNFKKVITGHYHSRSVRKVDGTEFVYVGTPYQMNRGDIGEQRGFMILDTDTMEHEFIDNIVSPKFVKMEFPTKFKCKEIKNNFIDVYVRCENNHYNEKMLEKYLNAITECEPIFKPFIFFVTSESDVMNFDVSVENMGNISKLINDYISSSEIENKDIVSKKMIELYEQTKSSDGVD